MTIQLVRTMSLTMTLVLAVPAMVAADDLTPGEALTLPDHMPNDPLLAFTTNVGDLSKLLDDMVEMIAQFDPEATSDKLDASLAELDAKLGFSLRDEFLEQVGPEVGIVIDLPPIDEAMAAFSDPAAGIPRFLGQIAVLSRVRDGARVDRALRGLFAMYEAEASDHEDGLVRIRYGGSSDADEPGMELYYGIRDGILALGTDPERLRATLSPRPAGERLTDGADFKRVFAKLDRHPASLTYLNLPKIRQQVDESSMLQGVITSDEESAAVYRMFAIDDVSATGLGSTTVEFDGGVRTSTFGPSMWSGNRMGAGIVAAVAIPNFLNAIDRGKQKRTIADVRTVGTVMESFALDNDRYPGPTDGWVDLDAIAGQVEPIYVKVLPRVDGWGHPIQIWSDGESYRIVSPGKDGEVEGDWLGEIAPEPIYDFDADIVFADGAFLTWPEGDDE